MNSIESMVVDNSSWGQFTSAGANNLATTTVNAGMTTGTVTFGSTFYPNYPYTNWYTTYWPSYYHYEQNKTEQAYKIIRALMKAKVIKVQSLNRFFETMDAILEVI